ncbi:MAG: hypothetical protein DRQ55_13220 [Planctomycetota bacterium]|nr:MAG: hypothetical protein DRQ55_13220 [Planctomycetota bacterium]
MSASKTCLASVVAEGLRASCRDHSKFLGLVLGARNVSTQRAVQAALLLSVLTPGVRAGPAGDGPIDLALGGLSGPTALAHEGGFPDGTLALSAQVTLCNLGADAVPFEAAMSPDHPGVALQLYRVASGPGGHERLVQVGTSWVHHRFAALGQSFCGSCSGGPGLSALQPGCSDAVSASVLGDAFWLGPRQEWSAFTGSWSCLGSFFDGLPADCVRDEDGGGTAPTEARLAIDDQELLLAGATYWLEALALTANEASPFDNLGSRAVQFSWNGASWSVQAPSAGNALVSGPAVLRWGDDSGSADLNPHDGEVVASIDVTDLGAGLWRYELAFFNRSLDGGIDRLDLPRGAVLLDVTSADGDGDPSNDWTASSNGSTLRWQAPNAGAALAFCELMSVGFTTDAAPGPGELVAGVMSPGLGGGQLELPLTLPDHGGAFSDQGCALPGLAGAPWLAGSGDLSAGSAQAIALVNASPLSLAGLFVSLSSTPVPFKGGTLKPFPPFDPILLPTDGAGEITLPFVMPAGVPTGTQLWLQWAVQDGGAVKGVALSNALRGLTP